jgi:hypothetical protein
VLNQSRLPYAAQLDALRKFARRKKISEDLVVAVFETERLRLTEGAKIERFVDVLAEKRTRRALSAGGKSVRDQRAGNANTRGNPNR